MRKDVLRTEIGRREFTAGSIMAFLAGITVMISGCDDDNPAGPSGGDESGTVSENHGHVATLTAAEVSAGAAVVLHIRGTGDHDHTVNLTTDEVRAVGAGTRTAKRSSNDLAHDHMVTFNP
jgi:hypothetical protein